MFKKIALLCSLIIGLGFSTNTAHATPPIETTAKQAIVVDYETGAVLLAKNADQKMPTSSMSKVMTMYAVFEALKNNRLALDDTLPVSEKAWRMQGSKMFVELNNRIKVEDLIRGVIVQSGNDATIVLAEGVAGNEDAFAAMITEKAKQLGMENSNFTNASGWPDPNHYSTARDLSILGTALIKNFPDYYKYYAEKEFTYHNIKQGNRNPLLYRNIGADGIKTGHTEDAGYGLIGSGVENGRRVIIVVNGLTGQQERADESAKLLEWGLKRFENKAIIKAGTELGKAEVVMGMTPEVPLTIQEDLFMTVPKFVTSGTKAEITYNGPLVAPIQQGQEVGTLTLTIPEFGEVKAPVVTAAPVAELGLVAKTIMKARRLAGGQ